MKNEIIMKKHVIVIALILTVYILSFGPVMLLSGVIANPLAGGCYRDYLVSGVLGDGSYGAGWFGIWLCGMVSGDDKMEKTGICWRIPR